MIRSVVNENMEAARLMFYKASETPNEWRDATHLHEVARTSFDNAFARAQSWDHTHLLENLALFDREIIKMVRLAQKKRNLVNKDDTQIEQQFEKIRVQTTHFAANIHKLLDEVETSLLS